MADPHVVSALKDKRTEIERTIVYYQEKIKEARADLVHVAQTLRLFETPDEKRSFPAHGNVSRLFGWRELPRAAPAADTAPQPNAGSEHGGSQNRPVEEKGFWDRVIGDPVALFTAILTAFTGVLAISTLLLWWHTWGAAAAAQKAANVAESALLDLERPYMFLLFEGLVTSSNPPEKTMIPIVQFRFKNYGKTPAIIASIKCGFEVGAEPPAERPMIDLPMRWERVISSEKTTDLFELSITPPMTGQVREDYLQRRTTLWLYGKITYRSIFNRDHETEFERPCGREMIGPQRYGVDRYS
jgi:hypothetical protein